MIKISKLVFVLLRHHMILEVHALAAIDHTIGTPLKRYALSAQMDKSTTKAKRYVKIVLLMLHLKIKESVMDVL